MNVVLTMSTGDVKPLSQTFTIQPECTKKSKSFTHFEESICSQH